MKEALEFHLEDLDEMPEPKGIAQHIANGVFDDLDGQYYFTELEIEIPHHA